MKKLLWWVYYGLSLSGLVASGFFLARELSDSRHYSYALSEQVLDDVRAKVDVALFQLLPQGPGDRVARLAHLVDQALDDGDIDRAESYLVHAPVILGGSWGEDYEKAVNLKNEGVSEEQLAIDLALSWLPPQTALRYSNQSSPLGRSLQAAEDATEGFLFGDSQSLAGLGGAVTSDFLLWGDIRDFSVESWHFARGEEVDYVIYTLSGIGLGLTATTIATNGATAPVKGAASLLKAAKRADVLTQPFTRELGNKVLKAVPPDSLNANLRDGIQTLTLDQVINGGAKQHFEKAWVRSIDEQAYGVLQADLKQVGQIYDATDAQITIRLLRHVDGGNDLGRLNQITQASPKSMRILDHGLGPKLLDLAKGSLKISAKIIWPAIGLLVSLLLSLVMIAPKLAFRKVIKATLAEAPQSGGDNKPSYK